MMDAFSSMDKTVTFAIWSFTRGMAALVTVRAFHGCRGVIRANTINWQVKFYTQYQGFNLVP